MLKYPKLSLMVLTLCLLVGCGSFSQNPKAVKGLDICKSEIKVVQLNEAEIETATNESLRNYTYINCTLQKVCKVKVPNGELCPE